MQNSIFNQYLSTVNRFANIKVKDQFFYPFNFEFHLYKKEILIQFFLESTVAPYTIHT